MKEVVLIPCFNRPEFLWHCLNRISQAYEAETKDYIFLVDNGAHSHIYRIIELFQFPYNIVKPKVIGNRTMKQSFNLINGYKIASDLGYDIIHMIEEDVFISTDYFQFHRLAHQSHPDNFCVIATENHNSFIERPESINHYYFGSENDYQSLGVSFPRQIIQDLIIPHHTNAYYSNPGKYCAEKFPNSPIGSFYTEQDGLIRRIKGNNKSRMVVFANVPRAFHAGYYGKNRNTRIRREVELFDKIEQVKRIAFDVEEVKNAAQNEDCFRDSIPVKLNYPKLKSLYETRI